MPCKRRRAFVGIVIASLVLLPEGIATLRGPPEPIGCRPA